MCILFQAIMVCVLICGGGNGAHAAAGIVATQPGMEARVLTLYADEAERWTTAMQVSVLSAGENIIINNSYNAEIFVCELWV